MQEIWVRSLGQEDPWRRKWQPMPVLLPGKSHGWRSLVGYSLWGCKEADTTEPLCFASLHFKQTQVKPGQKLQALYSVPNMVAGRQGRSSTSAYCGEKRDTVHLENVMTDIDSSSGIYCGRGVTALWSHQGRFVKEMKQVEGGPVED